MAEVVLWKAKDLGYLAVTADAALARGELRPRAAEFKAGRLGKSRSHRGGVKDPVGSKYSCGASPLAGKKST